MVYEDRKQGCAVIFEGRYGDVLENGVNINKYSFYRLNIVTKELRSFRLGASQKSEKRYSENYFTKYWHKKTKIMGNTNIRIYYTFQ